MAVARHIVVLDHGPKIAEGTPQQIVETRGSDPCLSRLLWQSAGSGRRACLNCPASAPVRLGAAITGSTFRSAKGEESACSATTAPARAPQNPPPHRLQGDLGTGKLPEPVRTKYTETLLSALGYVTETREPANVAHPLRPRNCGNRALVSPGLLVKAMGIRATPHLRGSQKLGSSRLTAVSFDDGATTFKSCRS